MAFTTKQEIILYHYNPTKDNPVMFELQNLQEFPELGGEVESLEKTCFGDLMRAYAPGLLNYGDSFDFKFLYDSTQPDFETLSGMAGAERGWCLRFYDKDGSIREAHWTGMPRVKIDGIGVNTLITYTLKIRPSSAITWKNIPKS